MMNTTLHAPVRLSREEIRSQLAVKPGSPLDVDLSALLERVEATARPKSVHRVAYVRARGAKTVCIENVTFNSQVMRMNLDQVERIFPFVATCGVEVAQIPRTSNDVLQRYWLNAIQLALLQISLAYLRETVKTHYHLENLAAMNPGSGEASVWPIEEQAALFSLLGGEEMIRQEIGVQLQPSYLMVPEMSASGILFPSETSYTNCQLCQRENCPGRRAHFDADLWAAAQAENPG